MLTLAFRVTAVAVCAAVMGCSNDAASPPPPVTNLAIAAPGPLMARVVAPESNAKPSDYDVEMATLRVLGVEPGDGPSHAFAVISEVGSWQTREYRVGDTLGRGLRVTRLDRDRVTLQGTGEVRELVVGVDTRIERIVHKFDRAATNVGRHYWRVDKALLAGVRDAHGIGASGMPMRLMKQDALQLSDVQPGSLVDRLGFRSGDFLLAVDGVPVTDGSLEAMCDRLVNSGSEVHVSAYRRGSALELTFGPFEVSHSLAR